MKPILFNTEMVKAILDGRKTVTRRLVKRTPSNDEPHGYGFWREFNERDNTWYIKDYTHSCTWWPENEYLQRFGKYKAGDILYVRETWQCLNPYSDKEYVYKASCDVDFASDIGKWCPSIHMPKEAARIFLRVKDVRVERLQDMDHDSPAKEGIRGYTKDGNLYKFAVSDDWWMDYHRTHKKEFGGTYWQDMPKNPTIGFSYLWNSTIPKKDPEDMYKYGWKANPWVWVYEFERTDCNGESFKVSR